MISNRSIRDVLLAAAERLSTEAASKTLTTRDLKRVASEIGGYLESSIIPSDFCYDSINEDATSFIDPMFTRPKRGVYQFLGLNYSYTGAIYWKPKSGEKRQVGSWTDGIYHLEHDPRNL